MPTPTVVVDDVIIPPEQSPNGTRSAPESAAFMGLSQALAQDPRRAIQRLIEIAMKLTAADSAGVSSVDTEQGEPVFRWIATAGEYSRYLNSTMPRGFSPCGTVLDRGKALIMRDPVKFFPYITKLHAPVRSALLVPFGKHGKLIGTVWVITHQEGKVFTTDDLRAVESLTMFATSILDALEKRERGEPGLH